MFILSIVKISSVQLGGIFLFKMSFIFADTDFITFFCSLYWYVIYFVFL